MKKILVALSLLLAFPVLAATSYGTGAINDAFSATLVAVNDQICYNNLNLGSKLATVQWTVVAAGSGGVTVQISKDSGTNAIVGVPNSTLTSSASANPSTAPWVNNGPVVGTYETAIPSNTTNFCILYQTGGTATTITLAPGKPYASSSSVTATLFDTTSAVNTAIDSGSLDLSGWEYATVSYTTPAGGSGTISMVDDAGTSVTMFTVPASAGAWYPFAVASPSATQVTALPATGSTGALPLQKRMRFQSAAVAALTSRIRIEVRR